MENYNIKKPEYVKDRKRVGRGSSSGLGKTSGRGTKGQRSRSGGKVRPGFEGGQMPIQRRVPKRGFNNIFKKNVEIVNLAQLAKLSDKEITVEVLAKAGLVSSPKSLVKVLGNGEIEKALTLKIDSCSKSAKEKIEKAGGSIEIK